MRKKTGHQVTKSRSFTKKILVLLCVFMPLWQESEQFPNLDEIEIAERE
jgi:hypothetical protein